MDLQKKFQEIRVYIEDNKQSLHKPVLLLFALSQCFQNKDRLIPFNIIDQEFQDIFLNLSLVGKLDNSHYPFGKLENDEIWEVQNSIDLKRTSVGHLFKSELLNKQVCGGFTQEIYDALNANKHLLLTIANDLLYRYFPEELHGTLLLHLKLPALDIHTSTSKIAEKLPGYADYNLDRSHHEGNKKNMETVENGYIAYLNSLHNLSSNSANALAESQALNRYFADLYQPFPIVDAVVSALQGGERVVVLTGHAGDGKSTIALDLLKRLKSLPPNEPLQEALKEREEVIGLPSGKVTIIKDMSELSAQTRLDWLNEAFNHSGSWLLVSNTGPLLDTLGKLAELRGQLSDVENDVLAILDTPYDEGDLDRHLLTDRFGKDLVIFNLTRLDNVALAGQVLGKMLDHPAWDECSGCSAQTACPLQLNRRGLLKLGIAAQDRVRWVYQRLSQYEQRLTFRQMVAHMALALTGGLSCTQAQKQVDSSIAEGMEKGLEGLATIVFSEGFFGYRDGKPWPEAERLRAVALVRRLATGGPMAVNYERQLIRSEGLNWAELPDEMAALGKRWRDKGINASGVRWRFALRRLLYVFGLPSGDPVKAGLFIDSFLQSPRLRDFDCWQRESRLCLSRGENKKLLRACFRVLLECYSGFSVGQFYNHDRLYLTLRRTDRNIAQPTQLVIGSVSFDEFQLDFDKDNRHLLLRHRPGKAVLKLSLPLLDYIQCRDAGELGGELARIHWAQLEAFRAELLKEVNGNRGTGEIALLRANINGEVKVHRYLLDSANNTLEVDD
ncbi:hypothetical protein [Methylobacter marinus]|uniref:hypothetical protein n=1 Tax=Methylobacter marinus TaxID=34058 RepID=UPI0003607F1F|nr:hypothetical protein [Methylobacter marinus]